MDFPSDDVIMIMSQSETFLLMTSQGISLLFTLD